MQFEVEQKFPVADLADIEYRLSVLGATFVDEVVQVDRYFAHPSRDFAKTDEAIRIRQVGDANFITYKGPKIDTTTKTRKEIELPLHDGQRQAEQWGSLLGALGFAPVAVVRKRRRNAHIAWQDAEIEVALDQVGDLGDFVELELNADEESLDVAKPKIQSLADELGLTGSEQLSYLELLLAKAD
ncbi:MAG: class IV adenylate cyclase [Planctomycetes bacterium]|nr:class IV adenylate cyclase [Planctomycetota bacterium]MBL7041158.1 class IV adenylate cyclase [Pirellulaceae bacterium]